MPPFRGKDKEQGIFKTCLTTEAKLPLYTVFIFTVTHLEDVGALVDDNLFERDILIATKKLACLSNINERSQGIKANPVTMHMYRCHYALL